MSDSNVHKLKFIELGRMFPTISIYSMTSNKTTNKINGKYDEIKDEKTNQNDIN